MVSVCSTKYSVLSIITYKITVKHEADSVLLLEDSLSVISYENPHRFMNLFGSHFGVPCI